MRGDEKNKNRKVNRRGEDERKWRGRGQEESRGEEKDIIVTYSNSQHSYYHPHPIQASA